MGGSLYLLYFLCVCLGGESVGPRGLVVNNVVVDRVHLEDVLSQSRVPRPARDTGIGFLLAFDVCGQVGLGHWKGVSRTHGLILRARTQRTPPIPSSAKSVCICLSVPRAVGVLCSVQCDRNPRPGGCAVPCVCRVARVSSQDPGGVVAQGLHGRPLPPAQQRPSRTAPGPQSGRRRAGNLLASMGPLPRPGAPLEMRRPPPLPGGPRGSAGPSRLPVGVPHPAPSPRPPRAHLEVTEPEGRRDVQASPSFCASSPSARHGSHSALGDPGQDQTRTPVQRQALRNASRQATGDSGASWGPSAGL